MPRAPRISRAHVVALPEPAAANEWVAAGIAVALILAGLLF